MAIAAHTTVCRANGYCLLINSGYCGLYLATNGLSPCALTTAVAGGYLDSRNSGAYDGRQLSPLVFVFTQRRIEFDFCDAVASNQRHQAHIVKSSAGNHSVNLQWRNLTPVIYLA